MRLPAFAARLVLLAAVAFCAAPIAATADNLAFLKSAAVAHFKGDDYQLMKNNLKEVLESPAPHASQEWHNPKTKSHGMAQVRSTFIATDGALCKRLRVSNEAGGVKGEGTQVLCRYAGRGWLFHPDAEPAAQ